MKNDRDNRYTNKITVFTNQERIYRYTGYLEIVLGDGGDRCSNAEELYITIIHTKSELINYITRNH